jgi:hypothetical protein
MGKTWLKSLMRSQTLPKKYQKIGLQILCTVSENNQSKKSILKK